MTKVNYFAEAPKAMQILFEQEEYLKSQFTEQQALGMKLLELVKLRVSQINQCAFCIDMHSKDAESAGESWQRLIGLSAWREAPYYSVNERLALECAERLTACTELDDELYQKALDAFGAKALVDLSIAINAINSWNRIAITFKPEVGSYKPS